jgi:hypothetical protein
MKPSHGLPNVDDIDRATKRGNGSTRQRERFKLVRAENYTYDPTTEEWLVQGLLPARGLAVLYAKWKSFKSFVALNLAVAVAQGASWAGRKTRRGTVIYIVCEGQGAGFRKRVAAYGGLAGVDLYILEARPNLGTHPGDVAELVKTIAAQLSADSGPVLIVIDTLARCLAGRDENGEGMQNFINNGEDLADAFQCLTLAVHHEGAGDSGRMRGYSMADAASVATWRLTKNKGDGLSAILTVVEAKDSVSDLDFAVKLKRVELGDEHAERRESTLIVDKIEAAERPAGDGPKKTRERIPPALGAFTTSGEIAMHRHGIEVQLPITIEGAKPAKVKAVREELVRSIYYQKRGDLDPESKRKAFQRHLREAIDRELVVCGEINGQLMLWKPSKS